MKRPELGAIADVVLVTIFFLFAADRAMFTLFGMMNFMTPAAQLGILAIGAAMLMIGGEFDLSIGSMVAFAGLIFGSCVMTSGLPLIIAIPLTFLFAALVGAVNGSIVSTPTEIRKLTYAVICSRLIFNMKEIRYVGREATLPRV